MRAGPTPDPGWIRGIERVSSGGKCFLQGEMRMYETGQKGNTDWLPVGFPVDQQSLLFVKTKHLVLAVRMKDNDVSKSVGSSTCDVCSLEKSYALAKSS